MNPEAEDSEKESNTEYLKRKEKKKGLVYIGTKEEARGCRNKFNISEGLKAFKITIYGDNIEPVTETYRLDRDGKKYSQIKMQKINHKEVNNA